MIRRGRSRNRGLFVFSLVLLTGALVAGVFVIRMRLDAPTPEIRVPLRTVGATIEYDGRPIVFRGVSIPHDWYPERTRQALDDASELGANSARIVLGSGQSWRATPRREVEEIISQCRDLKMVCMLEVHDTTGYGYRPDAATLAQAVDYWLSIKSSLDGHEDLVAINIGNEPYADSAPRGYVEETIAAIKRLRDAGFQHLIVVDGPGFGQDASNVMRNNAQKIVESDVRRDTVISVHMYGEFAARQRVIDYLDYFEERNLPLIVGEFGAESAAGTPAFDTIMEQAAIRKLGYFGWSWSGNNRELDELDMVYDFDASRLTKWGKRYFWGEHGLNARTPTPSTSEPNRTPPTSVGGKPARP